MYNPWKLGFLKMKLFFKFLNLSTAKTVQRIEAVFKIMCTKILCLNLNFSFVSNCNFVIYKSLALQSCFQSIFFYFDLFVQKVILNFFFSSKFWMFYFVKSPTLLFVSNFDFVSSLRILALLFCFKSSI